MHDSGNIVEFRPDFKSLEDEKNDLYEQPKYDTWKVELDSEELCDSYEYMTCANRHHNEYACKDCCKVCNEQEDLH